VPWTFDSARAALLAAGILPLDRGVRVEPRDHVAIARLPSDHIAWFADDAIGAARLRTERHVLRLLEARCSFRVPRVVYEAPDGAFDVRATVPGVCDPWIAYARVKEDSAAARRIGCAVGYMLAEQHTRIARVDVEGWLPERPAWPEPSGWIRERLPRVVDDPPLCARIDALLDRYDAIAVDDADRVLVHADLGLHNLAIDPESFDVRGVFDYGDAAWADRHHDFRYLLFDFDRDDALDAALEVYVSAVGRPISRERVALYHAACAASFLAYRDGVASEATWCGRTLAGDLAWTRAALARAKQDA
jgi:hypothetical protein